MRLLLALYFQLARFPVLQRRLVQLWHRHGWRLAHLRWLLRARLHGFTGLYVRALDDNRLHWVPTSRIRYSALAEFDLLETKGHVLDGDWDRLEKPFENLDICVAFRNVLFEKQDWRQTIFYQRLLARIERGETPWGCRTQEELDRRCAKLSALAEAIRADGYKSQAELHPDAHKNPFAGKDEITVSIGRDGDLLFSNSAHRLAIAKVLGVPRVPVRIAVRHRQWVAFRRELERYASANGGRLPQPALHPDLCHIPACHDPVERLEMLGPYLPPAPARILIAGAGMGYECHRLEELGYICFAGEADGKTHAFLERLRRAEDRRFHIISEPLLTWQELPGHTFDAVLVTRSFPWEPADERQRQEIAHFLRTLHTPRLFLEAAPSPGFQTGAAPARPDAFIGFVLEQISFTHAIQIGFVSGDTPLYLLS